MGQWGDSIMNNGVYEKVVKRKISPYHIMLRIWIVIGVLFLIVAVSFLDYYVPNIDFLIALLYVSSCTLGIILWRRLNVEYEYTLMGRDLDISQITNGKKRKRVISVSSDQIAMMAPVCKKYARELDDKSYSKIYFLSQQNKGPGRWFIIKNKETTRELIIFEPSDEMVEEIARYARNKVFTEM